jgi:microcystin-dependent protein
MSDPFIGELRLLPYNFAPRGWAFCSGQLLSISQNTALFSLLGTTYGGNGQTTFGLPDLRGRVPLSSGQGPGLSTYTLGEAAGTESVTLTAQQMPGHNHGVNASSGDATDSQPGGHFPAAVGTGAYAKTSDGLMNQAMTAPVGRSQPHENRQPYLTLNWCIALEGIYPSRN